MSRYIDANLIGDRVSNGVVDYEVIKKIPTADVVSKEEYDKLNERYKRLLENATILTNAVCKYERRENEQIH